MTPKFDYLLPMLLWLVLIAAFCFWARSGLFGGRRKTLPGDFHPARKGRPHGAVRLWDALLVLSVGAALLFMVMTQAGYSGGFSRLREANPAFARLFTRVAIGAPILLLLCAFLAWRGFTMLGAGLAGFLAILTLATIGFKAQDFEPSRDKGFEGTVFEGTGDYTIRLQEEMPGAELWVNGVRLGEMPYKTTLKEFVAKVPYWAEPLANLKSETITIPDYQTWNGGWSQKRRWVEFVIPGKQDFSRGFGPRTSQLSEEAKKVDRKLCTYYARVKLGDEWGGGWSGGTGGGNVDGSRLHYAYTSYLRMVFPLAEERLHALFGKARLADYRVGADWFKAMETYGEFGWRRLRKAAETDPRLNEVFDAWAGWKYNLAAINNADEAWLAFERIGAEADRVGAYNTADLRGRAVELLTPRLDAKRLVNRAVSLLDSGRTYGYSRRSEFGRLQFSFPAQPLRGDIAAFPPSAYAVAHVIWMLHEQLRESPDGTPSPIQRELVSALMRRGLSDGNLLRIAAYFGGPDIWKYLMRKDWQRTEFTAFNYNDGFSVHGGKTVNHWFYFMASSPTIQGREFRLKYESRVLDMAETLLDKYGMRDSLDDISFLFLDLDQGEKSLALQFWPRYRKYCRGLRDSQSPEGLTWQWRYLAKTEPLPPVEMYMECWRANRGNHTDFASAINIISQLPRGKALELGRALDRQINADISNVSDSVLRKGIRSARADKDVRENLLRSLRPIRIKLMDEEAIEEFKSDLLKTDAKAEQLREGVSGWLEYGAPDHPMVEAFARCEEPRLRLLTVGALAGYPTAERRRLLAELLEDKDPAVREAAQEARKRLDTLAATPAGDFANPGTEMR